VSAAAPGRLRRCAELLALTAFALAQPVLDVTGRSPDFFLFRQPSAWDVRLLVLLVALGPPVLLFGVEEAVGLVRPRAVRPLHWTFRAVLFAVVAVVAGKKLLPFTGVPLALVAVVLGVVLTVLVERSGGFRQAILYATPAPLVFALLFVATTPAGALARPHRGSGVGGLAATRPPVVVLLLDEFPVRSLLTDQGTVDQRLFPNFARLAGASTWYPNATGVSGWTPWAVPAMLTGVYPEKALAPHYSAHPRNLFTLLSRSYDVKAFESIAQLCPPSTCTDVHAGRPTGLGPLVKDTATVAREVVSPYPAKERVGDEFAEAPAGEAETDDPRFRFDEADRNQPGRFTAFLDTVKPADRPTLSFLHLLLPHGTHKLLPSGRKYEVGPLQHVLPKPVPGKPRVLPKDPNLAVLARERMLLQLVYTDGLLGRMLDRMESTGLLDEALLVVTADHGVGFTPGSHWRWVDEGNTADVAWVPLFVKRPGQRKAAVDARNAQGVDLLPTVADVLDVEVPWRTDGRSVLGEARPTDDKRWYDQPGKPQTIDGARWLPQARTGFADDTGRPELGPNGLFAVGGARDLYGRKVSSLSVGAPGPRRLTLSPDLRLDAVDLTSGTVPAMLYGDLDGPVASSSTWLAVGVNGTIAGGVVALPGLDDGKWRFYGVVDDRFYRDGRNDVTFYTMEGSVLHPLGRTP
jgi:hypothetical protein